MKAKTHRARCGNPKKKAAEATAVQTAVVNDFEGIAGENGTLLDSRKITKHIKAQDVALYKSTSIQSRVSKDRVRTQVKALG